MSKSNNTRPNYLLREFDKSLYNASYFGFVPIETPHIPLKDLSLPKDCGLDMQDKAAFLRYFQEKELNSLPLPISISYKRKDAGKKTYTHSLHIIGLQSALAEALLIRTTLSILSERGFGHLIVEINSVGDKESMLAYERELHNCAKKISAELTVEQKKLLKTNILELLNLDLPDETKSRIPLSIASLTSPSRAHFKEMLEYLEVLGIEFRLAHKLIGNKGFTSHTIFEVRDADDNKLLAEGYRYTPLTKRLGFKKEIPAATVTIFNSDNKKVFTAGTERTYKELPKPKFYLIQLGQNAKMKSLPLIELLRQHHISLYHFLGKDKIIPQLSHSENLKVPYLIIIGQKEALDNTVTVRNVSTRAQETVKVDDLPRYLKNIAL